MQHLFIGDIATALPAFLSERSYSQLVILTDTAVQQYCLPILLEKVPLLLTASLICIETGEQYKNIDTCSYIWRQLLAAGADRQTLLLNLGGGVVGDMGGFAAATYQRGIGFIHLPTTLLAQIDAAIGGKLAIDFDGLKNMVGLFRQPEAIFADPFFLATLPTRQLRSGYAEMLKHALIADPEQFAILDPDTLPRTEAHTWGQDPSEVAAISRAAAIKMAVVRDDPQEKGLRKILNFGHTIGHALESWSLVRQPNDPLLHGEAIAAGMIAELYLSQQVAGFPTAQFNRVATRLRSLFPQQMIKTACQAAFNGDDLFWHALGKDKKNVGNSYRFVLLRQIGSPIWDIEINQQDIKKALAICREWASN